MEGWQYLVIVDCFSGWCEIKRTKTWTATAGSPRLTSTMQQVFAVVSGVPSEVLSDVGPEFLASETLDFFYCWGITHPLSSAYHPLSNGRAELGVKSMKRLLWDNVGPGGI